MSVTIRIEGDKEMAAVLVRLGVEAPMAAAAALFQEAELIMARSKEYVPVDQAILRTSGHVQKPVIRSDGASVTMGYGGAAAPYAVYVHEGIGPAVGRPAFMPPAKVFEGWVRRNIGGTEQEIRRIAFLVARAVGRRGLKPTKFLERAMNEAAPGTRARVAKRLNQWLETKARWR